MVETTIRGRASPSPTIRRSTRPSGAASLPGVRDEKPVVHLLLLSPGLDPTIGVKLAGAAD